MPNDELHTLTFILVKPSHSRHSESSPPTHGSPARIHIDRRHSSSPSLALIEAVPPSPSSLCSPHHRCCAALTIVISVLLIIVFAVLTSLNSLNGFLVSQKQNWCEECKE
nr:uncharacterized protein LOC114924744 [Arachis hypogaea]